MLIRALNINVLQKTQNTFVSTKKMIVRVLLRRTILPLISMNFYWKHFSIQIWVHFNYRGDRFVDHLVCSLKYCHTNLLTAISRIFVTNEQSHPLADACARYSSNYNTIGAMIQASDSMLKK